MIEVEKSYNLCPICGLESPTTSRICPTHISVTYGADGKIIHRVDYKEVPTFLVDNKEVKGLHLRKGPVAIWE